MLALTLYSLLSDVLCRLEFKGHWGSSLDWQIILFKDTFFLSCGTSNKSVYSVSGNKISFSLSHGRSEHVLQKYL